MAVIVFMTIPGVVLLLVTMVAIDRMGLAAHRRLRLPWRTEEAGRPLSAPGLDELHAILYATKRHELDQRRTSLVLRDDEHDGAPPHTQVDLTRGTATVCLPRTP